MTTIKDFTSCLLLGEYDMEVIHRNQERQGNPEIWRVKFNRQCATHDYRRHPLASETA